MPDTVSEKESSLNLSYDKSSTHKSDDLTKPKVVDSLSFSGLKLVYQSYSVHARNDIYSMVGSTAPSRYQLLKFHSK